MKDDTKEKERSTKKRKIEVCGKIYTISYSFHFKQMNTKDKEEKENDSIEQEVVVCAQNSQSRAHPTLSVCYLYWVLL